jgi:hypothetical protein
MAQRLIVEGNDAIALAMLCKKRGLPPPSGYESPSKFQHEFVKSAGGYDQALVVLQDSLDNANLTNIGIIVDANDQGFEARWTSIRNILASKYATSILQIADNQAGYKIIEEEGLPRLGLWIMPDNSSNGYLEHFLAGLVPAGDQIWIKAEAVVQELLTEPFNELRPAKIGKANLHTWLAWKREPGKPFGQAIDAGYFDVNKDSVQPFLNWFANVFELSNS